MKEIDPQFNRIQYKKTSTTPQVTALERQEVEQAMPQLIQNLIPRIQNCKISRDAFAILSAACGGTNGLTYEAGQYHCGDYSIVLINNPNQSSSLEALKINKESRFKSRPSLAETISINEQELFAIVKLENRAKLINYNKAINGDLVTTAAKQAFLAEMRELISLGINPQKIIETDARNLLYDKDKDRIVFADLDIGTIQEININEAMMSLTKSV
jgi:hypothetical protein